MITLSFSVEFYIAYHKDYRNDDCVFIIDTETDYRIRDYDFYKIM